MYRLCPTWSKLVVASQKQDKGLLWRFCLWLELVHLCGRGPQIPSVLNSGSRGKPLGSQSEKELESILGVYLIIIVNVSLSMVVTLLYELVPEREESPFDLWKIIFDHHLWIIVLIWLYCERVKGRPLRVVVFDFESNSSKKSEYRVAIAVLDSVISDVILSRFDWILK